MIGQNSPPAGGALRRPPRLAPRGLLALALAAVILCQPTAGTAAAQSDNCREPNSGFTNACLVDPRTPTVSGHIATSDDVDVYKLVVSDSLARVHVALERAPADYDLQIFDHNGSFIGESKRRGADLDELDLLLIGGAYFVFVSSGHGDADASQPYVLAIGVTPHEGPRPGTLGDQCPEPNDSFERACMLRPGLLAHGGLATDSDVDTFHFDVRDTDSDVTIRLGDAPDDVEYALYHDDRSEEGRTEASSTLVGRLQPGRYYVQVRRRGSGAAAPYELLVTVTPPSLSSMANGRDPCPEPNDENALSCALESTTPALGFLTLATDQDRYSFEVAGGRTWVHLELTDLPADYDLELQDQSGFIASSHNAGAFPEVLDVYLEPGTYYAVVYSLLEQANDARPYKLSMSMAADSSGQTPASRVFFADTFNAVGANFPTQSRSPERYAVGYQDGEYVVSLLAGAQPSNPAPEADEPAGAFIDSSYQLDLDARVTRLPEQQGGFTVQLRWTNDGNTYSLYVDTVRNGNPGAAVFGYWKNGDWQALTPWTESPAIRKGEQKNHVTIRAMGELIAVSINGQELFEVRDSTFSHGDIALGTWTRDRATETRFDNVLVTAWP